MNGENLVVVGKSGTGKSVLIKCIVGLLSFDSGSINVFEKDVLVSNFTGNEVAAGFNYNYTTINPVAPLPPDSGFGKVVLNYTAPNGNKYSTYNAFAAHNQLNNSFVVSKATPYQNNSAGQKTYKMEGSFKAWFYNVNNANDSIYIETTKFKTKNTSTYISNTLSFNRPDKRISDEILNYMRNNIMNYLYLLAHNKPQISSIQVERSSSFQPNPIPQQISKLKSSIGMLSKYLFKTKSLSV
jgi:ABC-type oligopeptide transport system ATPase subunit